MTNLNINSFFPLPQWPENPDTQCGRCSTVTQRPSLKGFHSLPHFVDFCCCAAVNYTNWISAFLFFFSLGSNFFFFLQLSADWQTSWQDGVHGFSLQALTSPRCVRHRHAEALSHTLQPFSFLCVYTTFYSWSPGCPEPSFVPLFAEKSLEGRIRKRNNHNDDENKVRIVNTGGVLD